MGARPIVPIFSSNAAPRATLRPMPNDNTRGTGRFGRATRSGFLRACRSSINRSFGHFSLTPLHPEMLQRLQGAHADHQPERPEDRGAFRRTSS